MDAASSANYLPLLMQIAVAAAFVIFTLFVTHKLTPRISSTKKDDNFECGIDAQGNARFPVSIRYFMTAILFVLFDVEVIFFYPYAVNFYELKLEGLLAVIMFVGFFLTGFYYIYKKSIRMGKIENLETINGEGYELTTLDKAIALARANSVWPLPFATSCCGIEFMATMGSAYDLSRFGMERMSFTPRQADLLIVAGTISKKLGPVLKRVYEQMAEPKWVLSVGACASSGGIFDTYSVLQGIDRIIPVDVYVPGCPPRPEQIIEGVMNIHELVKKESNRRRYSEEYKHLLDTYEIEIDQNGDAK